jgi:hypothetical protein
MSRGTPWFLRQPLRSQYFALPNASAANQAIVRVDVHELLGATEVRDLAVAVKKVPQYYRASKRVAVSVNAEETKFHCVRRELPRQINLRMTAIVAVITPSGNRLKLESATDQATVLNVVREIKWV